MGLIPQAKCSRCDRIYSGLRTRCPYCGARRRKKGKRVEDTDNAVWKLVVGALLLVVLIAAVIVLLVNTFSGEDDAANDLPNDDEITNLDEGVDSIVGDNTVDDIVGDDTTGDDQTDVPDEPVIPDTIKAESIAIYYGDQEKTDVTMKVTENLQFRAQTVPAAIDSVPLWETSNDEVFVVLQSGLVTAVGEGTATLVVTVDGVSASCIIRVKPAN